MAIATRESLTTTEVVEARLTGRKFSPLGIAFQVLLLGALLTALAILAVLLVSIVQGAIPTLSERGLWNFLTSDLRSSPSASGVLQGIIGTFVIALFVIAIAFPLGIGAAIYLEEYASRNRFTRIIEVNIRNLAGVPSVVYGLLGLAVFVQLLDTGWQPFPVPDLTAPDIGIPVVQQIVNLAYWIVEFVPTVLNLPFNTGGRSIISAGFTLAVLSLPLVIITAAEAVRAVPQGLREAGFGVGATRWEVIRHHVLPYAAPGVLTGTVLALARGIGESAPLILLGAASFYQLGQGTSTLEALQGPFTALPYIIFDWARQPSAAVRNATSAAALVLLVMLVVINAGAIALRNSYEKKRVA